MHVLRAHDREASADRRRSRRSLVGPERLPRYAEALAQLHDARARVGLAPRKTRVKDEMGEDFDDVDWRTLDPRQYDPRRIIREALLDDAPVPTVRAARGRPRSVDRASATTPLGDAVHAGRRPPPFDAEAT